MDTSLSTCEISESNECLEFASKINEKGKNHYVPKSGIKCATYDDINRLFEAIDVKISAKNLSVLRKSALKRPIRISSSQGMGIGISEPVNLKQALRGLCISQAAEMAATKRLSKPQGSSRSSEAGNIKRLYRAVVVEANESGLPLNDGRGNFFKFSLVSEEITSHSSEKVSKSPQVLRAESSNHDTHLSTPLGIVTRPKAVMNKLPSLGQVVPLATECEKKKSKAEPQNLRLSVSITREIAKEVEIIAPTLVERPVNYFVPDKEEKDKLSSEVLLPSSRNWRRVSKCGSNSPHLIKPVLRKKGFVKSKVKQDSTSASSSSSLFDASGNTDHDPSTSVLDGHMHSCTLNNESKEDLKTSAAALSSTNMRSEVNSSVAETCSRKPGFSLNFDNTTKAVVMKVDERSREKDEFSQSSKSTVGEYSSSTSITASSNTNMSTEVTSSVADTNLRKPGSSLNFGDRPKADKRSRSREKGEFSQSSKSSIGEYSSSTSMSEDSILSGSSRGGGRPHMSNDLRWEAIRCVQKQQGCLGMRHFKLQKQLGCGDIGTVYLAELTGTSCLFALKVMDIEFLMGKKKMSRAQTEREIMQILDHPFLPTLFAHFTTNKLLCLIMEYCPGGDLHVLRQKQPSKFFSEQAARFYVAEVLLALEYLHMLGVVYRDLKPENILVREDGHIMLSDFDLSLRCAVNSWVVKSSSPVEEPPPRKGLIPCSEASCIDPFCLHPSWQVSCFTPRLLSVAAKSRKIKSDLTAQASPTLQLVVEPTSARSNSFVGTHEYLAPEIIKGEGHGSPVDWWTFGIFLFELLYGRTPFKGSGNEETLSNVVSQNLRFPSYPVVSFHARDLIRGLLVKEPNSRLGALKGAAEIKQHPFFEGLNWALIRCAVPPELPRSVDAVTGLQAVSLQTKERTRLEEPKGGEEPVEFEMF